MERAAFTLAIGQMIYTEMAIALARSFLMWNSEKLPFVILTDIAEFALPSDLHRVCLRRFNKGELASGFSSKLSLDRIAPANESLFIDADCLCVASVKSIFLAFSGHAVGTIGRSIMDGDWFGNVASIRRILGVPGLPRFNGGIYFVRRGERCRRIFEVARELETRYDDLGFIRLRGRPNDEVLISAAMALCGETAIPDDGKLMNSLLAAPGGIDIDVLRGQAVLRNPKAHPRHNSWYSLDEMRPAIVHFLGMALDSYPYGREQRRLELVCRHRWPIWLAKLFVSATYSFSWLVRKALKDMLRPLFRQVVGIRRVQSGRP